LQGLSAACLARGLRDRDLPGKVITVDTFEGEGLMEKWRQHHSEEESLRRYAELVAPLETAQTHWEMVEVSSYIEPFVGLTADAAVHFADEEFDFIFVDADHTYEGVSADFVNWSPLLKSGGEMAFHDSFNPIHGVRVLMKEMPKRGWKLTQRAGGIRAWKKP
jgi:predicted O-methyltransferase YrrM